jgi:hypothetical protein
MSNFEEGRIQIQNHEKNWWIRIAGKLKVADLGGT